MPNYCENKVRVVAPDAESAKRFADAAQKGNLFEEFYPTPKELDNEGRYHWHIDNWGTKWDMIDEDSFAEVGEDNTVETNFCTAWSPPIGFYEKLNELGFEVLAYYNEPGMCFCGKYNNGSDDTYKYDSAENLRDTIPEDIYEMFEYEFDSFAEDSEEDIDDSDTDVEGDK